MAPAFLVPDRLLEHSESVLVDVLMVMVLVDLELQARNLGQHDVGEPRLHEHLDAGARVVGE